MLPAAEAFAQAERPTLTVGGTVGQGRTWDDEGSLGSGLLLGAYVDRRMTRRLDFEFAVDMLKNKRTDNFRAEGTTVYLSPMIAARFGPSSSNLFLLAGPSVAVYDGETFFFDGSDRRRRESVNFGWMAGAGLSFRTRQGIEIAPLVRIAMMQVETDSDPVSTITGGIRVGFGK